MWLSNMIAIVKGSIQDLQEKADEKFPDYEWILLFVDVRPFSITSILILTLVYWHAESGLNEEELLK